MVTERDFPETSLSRYVRFYALVLAPTLLAAIWATKYFPIAGMMIVFAASLSAGFTAQRFVKRERRSPTKRERDHLTHVSLLIWLAYLVIPGIIYGPGLFRNVEFDVSSPILLVIMVVFAAMMIGIAGLLVEIAYGSSAERLARKRSVKR
ncbi:ABZJ_00895 family protein [uncultured Algimonas sp.]|uniref:ABZJ_00895 family protein n=1 Tax=uncultured Algimonas sp. TaxID=1547920 RepID=UPI0026036702|nr:ABZJ_00895 family protein [uncultured Algimonas sp.]